MATMTLAPPKDNGAQNQRHNKGCNNQCPAGRNTAIPPAPVLPIAAMAAITAGKVIEILGGFAASALCRFVVDVQ